MAVQRFVKLFGMTVVLALVIGISPIPVEAQSGADSVPRTADGHPNLQGVWDYGSVTPLQRPVEMADKEFLTDEDVAEVEARAAARVDQAPPPGQTGAYNRFWFADGTEVSGTRRTSLIFDPPNGRLPEYTSTGRARMADRAAARQRNAGPEDRDVDERCILGFNSGPPMIPGAYNNYVQIFQVPGFVAIFNEMVNDVRLVPLDDRPALASDIQQWKGSSVGRWDGDTLVVETRNFRDIGTAHPAPNMALLEALGPNMHLEERFSRFDENTLLYQFTVTDPSAYTQPWSGELTMAKSDNALYEYACHEGNYGLFNILAGAQAAARQ